MSRVDYSELVEALKQKDERRSNELLKEVMPRLQDYLEVVMGAGEKEAVEIVQQSVLEVIERINKNKIRNEKYIFRYLIKACRHEFLRQKDYVKRFDYDPDHIQQMQSPARQIDHLLDEERQRILRECLEELDESSREFIMHFLVEPDTSTREASRHFSLSEANVRTRKSRLTGRLHECYKRKSG